MTRTGEGRRYPDGGAASEQPERSPPRSAKRPSIGLRGRLLLLIILALLPAFGILVHTDQGEREQTLADATRHALALSQRAASTQARFVAEAKTILSVLARLPALNQRRGRCPDLLRDYLGAQTGLVNIGIMDSTGHVVCSALGSGGGVEVSDRGYFHQVVARRTFVLGNYEIGRITHQPVMVAAYPILDASTGRPRSILFAALGLDWLGAVAARADLPMGSVFTLVDGGGHILARYPGTRRQVGQKAKRFGGLLAVSSTGRPLSTRMHFKGRDWLVTRMPLGKHAPLDKLHVVVAIPAARALAVADQVMYRNLVLLILVGIACLGIAWFSGALLVLSPMRRLLSAAGSITRGDLSVRTGITNGPAEVRALGYAFDEMAATLERRRLQNTTQNRRIARLNRIQQVLSTINSAIIRIRDRDELLREACRIAVELGDFSFAWVGLMDRDSDMLRLAAHAGSARDFISSVRVSVDAHRPDGRGLMGTCIRNNAHAMSNDVQNDPRLEAWREDFVRLGVHSAAAFPLCVDHRVVGALALYTGDPGFFDEREMALLDQLAADTSLGMEHIEKARQLDYLAYWDPLTRLPNQRLFEDRLEQSLRRAARLGAQVVILTIHVVEFNFISDTRGRAFGDRLLQALAARLATAVRESESLVHLGRHTARLSGQEFALALDDVRDLATADAVAQRINATLAEPIHLDGEEIAISLRMAAAVFPRDGKDAPGLLHKAQFALHNQPETGRGHVVFYSAEQDTAAQQRYELDAALRCAIERNEFYLEYQPRVDVRTGNLAGAEALLRWKWPDHGQVPPDQFIPALERTGLIDRVGAWVARTAFEQRLAWRDVVPASFVLSFNASSCELLDADYVARMRELVETTGMPVGWMELEITESGLMENGPNVLDTLASLKALGLRLSVDDFGTGYSSLSYLHQFPVDTLKIDKSFVRDMEHDDGARSIVRSIMGLAGALELNVVAEGVETERQLSLVTGEGCHEIQGYYFSRPLAPEALEALGRSGQPFKAL